MKLVYNLKKYFLNKKNLELQSSKHSHLFPTNKYINVFSSKETVISNDIYNSLSEQIDKYKNTDLKIYSSLHNHIYNSIYKILYEFDEKIQNIGMQKRKENSFAYFFKINFKDYKKGYISFYFYPDISITDEQYQKFTNMLIKEFFLLSQLLIKPNTYISESEKYINKYSSLTSNEAIECAYNHLSLLLEDFSIENKKNAKYEKYKELTRKRNYY